MGARIDGDPQGPCHDGAGGDIAAYDGNSEDAEHGRGNAHLGREPGPPAGLVVGRPGDLTRENSDANPTGEIQLPTADLSSLNSLSTWAWLEAPEDCPAAPGSGEGPRPGADVLLPLARIRPAG
ncbi:hypothetical protein [Streptomyces sp. NPDC005374]|uniref:hypothetical protein n=1 Tax=Streptomyces sp. NPDC005374 TaxID=3364713 RepID=UPI0036B60890